MCPKSFVDVIKKVILGADIECVAKHLSVLFWTYCNIFYVDGSISKGAIYMLGVTSYEESRNRKNLAASSSTRDNVTNADSRDKPEVCGCSCFVVFINMRIHGIGF